jgi:hypothetical protein
VVVVALISFLTGRSSQFTTAQCIPANTKHTQDITSLIRYAQEKAIAESREFRVTIDDEAGEFRLFRLKSQTLEGDKEFEPVAEADGGGAMNIPETLTISRITAGRDRKTGLRYISCYPNGASDPGEIELQTQIRGQQRISIKCLVH